MNTGSSHDRSRRAVTENDLGIATGTDTATHVLHGSNPDSNLIALPLATVTGLPAPAVTCCPAGRAHHFIASAAGIQPSGAYGAKSPTPPDRGDLVKPGYAGQLGGPAGADASVGMDVDVDHAGTVLRIRILIPRAYTIITIRYRLVVYLAIRYRLLMLG